jgi:acetyl esterase/lipase
VKQLGRRNVLALFGSLAAAVLPGCARGGTAGEAQGTPGAGEPDGGIRPQRYGYGEDPSQFADLYLPAGQRPGPVVVIIHGGYWRSTYGAELGEPLAVDLAGRGYACWNLEYRRAGNGGGWPQTFEDVSAGIDLLAAAAEEHGLDLGSVTALGHSAGGHLAVWAAGRAGLPQGVPGSGAPKVPLTAVVSQSGVLNLAQAHELGLSDGAVENLLGAPISADPERYRLADPMTAVPLAVPVYALHGEEDSNVPLSQSESYVAAAAAAGADAELVLIPGDHFAMITPGTSAWEAVVAAVEKAAGKQRDALGPGG